MAKRPEPQHKSRRRGIIRIVARAIVIVMLLVIAVILSTNVIVTYSARGRIYDLSDIETRSDIRQLDGTIDCIIVPGCGVYANQEPSPLLQDRLDTAIVLYKRGITDKLLFSGDHSGMYYNEVGVMREYAIEAGVPSEDIFLDHYGLSTSETIERAHDIYGIRTAVIVTQDYHLARALYLADTVGIDAVGVRAEGHIFDSQLDYSAREILARTKDFFMSFCTNDHDGAEIDITADGNITAERGAQ